MSQRFEFVETPLAGLFRVDRKPIADDRGFFSRFFCREEFKEAGFAGQVCQINHTLTRKQGAIRGLHYQLPPFCETKIVSCIQGEIVDVAVDVRKGSKTFLQWHMEILSSDNKSSLYIPDGFAHGFQTLTDECELIYLHSGFYAPDAEAALNALDPKLGIDWPLEVAGISERDRNHPMLDPQYEGIEVA